MNFGCNDIDDRIISLLFLAIGTVATIFVFAEYHNPFCGWIFLIFLIFFTRSFELKKAIPLLFICMVIALYISYNKALAPSDNILYKVILCMLVSLYIVIPLAIDAFLYRKVDDLHGLFILPLSFAAFEVAFTFTSLGNIVSIAYSQVGCLPTIQMASVIGSTGIVFMIALLATSIHLFVTKYREKVVIDRKAIACIAVVAIAVIAGGIRVAVTDVTDERVSMICFEGPAIGADVEHKPFEWEKNIVALDRDVEIAKNAGVTVLSFAEDSFFVQEDREKEFLLCVEKKAIESGLYISYGYILQNPEGDLLWNKTAFVTPDGVTQWVYTKTHLATVIENVRYHGDGTKYCTDTPFGRVTALICMDLEFPSFTSTIDDKADILISPSYDWSGIEWWHTYNNSLRAVENGCNLLRNCAVGTIGVYDYLGKQLFAETYDGSGEDYYIVEVPTKGTTTIFGTYGVYISYAYLIGFLLLMASIAYALFRKEP